MARIIGNLKPEDDYTHPLGPEPNFNESMYFNFFDAERSVGGFVRMGNRANEGYAELTVAVYLPGGRALFMFKRPEIGGNDAFDAGGLRFDVLEPAERLRTAYAGSVLELRDPTRLEDPSRAFRESPRRRLELELEHRAVGPLYGSVAERRADENPEQEFARAHYEQHMKVTGGLEIDGAERIPIEGFGLRDHSWGPRYWQAIHSYEWLTLNFGAELGAMVSVVRRDPERVRAGGVIVRGDALDPIVEAEVGADYADNGLYHRKVDARVKTRAGESYHFEGTVMGFIPLRNRRGDMLTHIGEGMTEWRLGGRRGYGLSEFLRQVR